MELSSCELYRRHQVPWSTDRWLSHQVTNFLFPLDGGAIGIVRVMSARKGGTRERERDRNKEEKGDRMVRALQVKHLWTGLPPPPPPFFLAAATTTISPVCVIRAGCSAFRLIPSWVVPWATQQLLLLLFIYISLLQSTFLCLVSFGVSTRVYQFVWHFLKHSSEAVRSFLLFLVFTKRPDTRAENKKFSSFECVREQSNLQDVKAF